MVTVELADLRVVAFPGRSSWSVMVAVTFAQAAVLLADGRKSASFTSLVNRITDPFDTSIAADLPTNQFIVRAGKGQGNAPLYD